MKRVIVIGANSGIGEDLALRYAREGACVIGTYRQSKNLIESDNIRLYPLDLAQKESVRAFRALIAVDNYSWDLMIFSVGTMIPIGNFFEVEGEHWESSFNDNFFGQLRLLREVRSLANKGAAVIFFTGGAPGGVLENFSAYSVAKIALTKMVEYLDAEDPDIKYAIVGPGWVNTRIHQQTLQSGRMAGKNFEKTQAFLQSNKKETTLLEIYECIQWIIENPRALVGGRNFSVVWDTWRSGEESEALKKRLSENEALFKLRRREHS